MSSATGSKWVAVLVIYFFVMTFIVSLVTTFTTVDVTEAQSTYTGCGSPRLIYESYNPAPVDISQAGSTLEKFYYGQFQCDTSRGVLSQTNCENLTGCTWEDPSNWLQELFGLSAVPTCTGLLDYTNVTDEIQYYNGGLIIDSYTFEGESTTNICTSPNVINNQTMCDVLSCTWGSFGGVSDLNVVDAQPSVGLGVSTWNTIKNMFTFSFNFGFDDSATNNILNFFVFWLPLLGLILAVYMLIRGGL